MKVVTFCGHSSLPPDPEYKIIHANLRSHIEKLILQGATTFLLGGYGEFDILCAQTVKELKEKYPHITSVLVIPYINRDYNRELYNCSEYPPLEKVPKRLAIIKRNEYMVDKADVVISYIRHNWGGAAATFQYAARKNKTIIRL